VYLWLWLAFNDFPEISAGDRSNGGDKRRKHRTNQNSRRIFGSHEGAVFMVQSLEKLQKLTSNVVQRFIKVEERARRYPTPVSWRAK
jgi:hypothetical protein